jgi:hypothetical protein
MIVNTLCSPLLIIQEPIDPQKVNGSPRRGFLLTPGDIEILRLMLDHRL